MPPIYSDYKLLKTDSDSIPKLLKLGYIPHGSPASHGLNGIFQAFVLPVEKPSESKNKDEYLYNDEEVNELIRKIQSTNNGYLFNPTDYEIALAKKSPDVFKYTYTGIAFYPHRIELK